MGLEVDLQGWAYWPGREDLSTEFTRLLGAAQEGGATVAECFAATAAAASIFSDDHSWYREWKKTADASYKRGNDALGKGHLLTARSNWLRAISYYQAAVVSPSIPGTRIVRAAIDSMARMRRPLSSATRNPARRGWFRFQWPGGYPLQGYFPSRRVRVLFQRPP